MPEMLLRRLGRAMVPANAEAETQINKLPEGRPVKAKIALRRSMPAHRLFFACVAAAAEHWPDGVEPEPEGDAELLRAWLLIRAGHADRIDFPIPDDDIQAQVMMASVTDLINRLRTRGEFPWIRTGEKNGQAMVRVFISKSMNCEALDETAFAPIRQHCFDTIEAIVGVRIEDLAMESEAVA
jgi:hypothetical protein